MNIRYSFVVVTAEVTSFSIHCFTSICDLFTDSPLYFIAVSAVSSLLALHEFCQDWKWVKQYLGGYKFKTDFDAETAAEKLATHLHEQEVEKFYLFMGTM
jgi:hypothetical protein